MCTDVSVDTVININNENENGDSENSKSNIMFDYTVAAINVGHSSTPVSDDPFE